MANRDRFLAAVLGAPGAQALDRLAAVPGARDVVPPRVALAWLALQKTEVYGNLPGCPEIPLTLRHDAACGGYQGVIGGPQGYAFGGAEPEHVAAAICAFLGVVPGTGVVRDVDMARLGKTIDLLAKAQVKPAHSMAPEMTHERKPLAPTRRAMPERGGFAAPQAPTPHAAPTGEETQAPSTKKPAAKPLTKVKLADSAGRKKCTTCGEPLFRDGKFKGCECMGGLAKSVTTTAIRGGYELGFGAGWDRDAVLALLEDLK